jgi:hypothetical protein
VGLFIGMLKGHGCGVQLKTKALEMRSRKPHTSPKAAWSGGEQERRTGQAYLCIDTVEDEPTFGVAASKGAMGQSRSMWALVVRLVQNDGLQRAEMLNRVTSPPCLDRSALHTRHDAI